MSPHATTPSPDGRDSYSSSAGFTRLGADDVPAPNMRKTSLLQRSDDAEVHDLVCAGFGPASLAIAVALHDALEDGGSVLANKQPKVRFLERQSRFAWHAGMLLPGAKMQITFVKDLATLRNPQSEFTFLNYLHKHGRLASFTNLGTFLPQRVEYEDYMRWCASHFDDVVDYGRTVEAVEVGKTNAVTGAVEYFHVRSRDLATGAVSVQKAKHVVIATGGAPHIPETLKANHPRIIHSSQYATNISKIFPPGTQPRSIAVVGGGQSAAEIFHNLPKRFPDSKTYLLLRGAALRPSDDSPFVNEIFDPERVDDIFSQDPTVRAVNIQADKATNYGVVRLELLEEIYSTLYFYRLQHESEDDWPQQILPHRTLTGMSERSGGPDRGVQLHLHNASAAHRSRKGAETETLDVDLVVVASGYRRDAHEQIMRSLRPLMPGNQERFTVSRDYDVQFRRGAVAPDAGIWLQGCNEATHGLSDTLLSILAVRGGEIVQSIFGLSQKSTAAAKARLVSDA